MYSWKEQGLGVLIWHVALKYIWQLNFPIWYAGNMKLAPNYIWCSDYMHGRFHAGQLVTATSWSFFFFPSETLNPAYSKSGMFKK